MGNKYSFWLESIDGLYASDKRKLVKIFGDPKQVYMAEEKEIIRVMEGREEGLCAAQTDESILLYHKHKKEHFGKSYKVQIPDASQRCRLLLEARQNSGDMEANWQKFTDKGMNFYCISDSGYPERLKNINNPPFGIYSLGKLPDGEITVGIVGSRRISSYGRRMAQELGQILGSKGISVISGMARGCDSTVQEAVMDSGGYTAAVLACGVDVCYPGEMKNLYNRIRTDGCIISELSPGTQPQPTFFPSRNRIIAGLSDILVVIEAAEQSGSLITADFALEQGKDVYACPGRVGDVMSIGCNRLIFQGAGIITSIYDFMEETGLNERYTNREKPTQTLASGGIPLDRFNSQSEFAGSNQHQRRSITETGSPNEMKILGILDDYPKNIQEIAAELEMPVNRILSGLTSLELKGMVRQTGTGFYSKE